MKKLLLISFLVAITILSSLSLDEMKSNFVDSEADLSETKISLKFHFLNEVLCDSVAIYRSYNPVEIPVDLYKLPIVKSVVFNQATFIDRNFASGVDYYYRVVGYFNGRPWAIGDNVKVSVPEKPLVIKKLRANQEDKRVYSLFIDKKNYLLQLWQNGYSLKSYPLAMGENPFTRKIQRDWVSSPEGVYKVVYIQKNATNYKAFDINYPTRMDRVRFDVAKDLKLIDSKSSIGGDIQIHGMDITTNWTSGSFALRNNDIDELIDSEVIDRTTHVYIVGYEFSYDDLPYLTRFWSKNEIRIIQTKLKAVGYDISLDGLMGNNTRKMIGTFQYNNGLKVTCELDKKTCRKVGFIPYVKKRIK